MKITQLKTLIKSGESNTLEFKPSTSKLKEAFETLCGFLNCEGGTVLIGIKDNGQINGQQVTDKTRQEIAKHINKLEPTVEPTVDYISTAKKTVIAINVKAGKHPPYSYDGRAFQRNQSTTKKMPRDLYQALLKEYDNHYSWEEIPVSDYTIDDLDHDEIQLAVRQGLVFSSPMNGNALINPLCRY